MLAALACLVLGVSAQDQLTRVTLNKRPLNLEAFEQQKKADQVALLSANAGEDIPILNFLDAQVCIITSVTRFERPRLPTLACLCAVLRRDRSWYAGAEVPSGVRHRQLQSLGPLFSVQLVQYSL